MQFGILRSVGLRRWGLTRLVISEALLIGLVASALSLIFGVLVGWTCLGLVRYVSNQWFEGVHTPLVIPWSSLVFGYALTFVLCFLAALWPAIASGRSERCRSCRPAGPPPEPVVAGGTRPRSRSLA